MKFHIVVACTAIDGGIGYRGEIPWHLSQDLRRFRQITTHAPKGKLNVVIMGRNTWESLPKNMRPLPSRFNIVITSTPLSLDYEDQNVATFPELEEALEFTNMHQEKIHEIFVIGGEQLYREALKHPACTKIYLTRIISPLYVCDRFFPIQSLETSSRYLRIHQQPMESIDGISYSFETYSVL